MRIVSTVIFIILAGLVVQTAQAKTGPTDVQMMPPTDFSATSNPCAGATAGILYWDGTTAIKCIPGTSGDASGNVGIGTAAPIGNLDVEPTPTQTATNPSTPATICLNGMCASSVFPSAISYPSVWLSKSYASSASCQSGWTCSPWQSAGSSLDITVLGPVRLLISYTGEYNCNTCALQSNGTIDDTYVNYEINAAQGGSPYEVLGFGFSDLPNSGVDVARRVIYSITSAGIYHFSILHRIATTNSASVTYYEGGVLSASILTN